MNVKTWAIVCLATVMAASVAGWGPSVEGADSDTDTALRNGGTLGAAEGAETQGEGDTTRLSPAQHKAAKAAGLPVHLTNSIGMKLVLIPPGEFMMGSPESEEGRFDNEGPQHRVRVTKPFFLGSHEVTVGQFRRFVEASRYKTEAERNGKGGLGVTADGWWEQKPEYTWRNPSFPQTDDHPVVNVSWNDAVAFCQWLSGQEEREYRLPTEAEWEYACRAGTTTRSYHGDDVEDLAQVGNVADAAAKKTFPNWYWTISESDGYAFTAPVGRFKGNGFGLFDMHGNVWEWCTDWFDEKYYANPPVDDPRGPASGSARVYRGASWRNSARYCRSAFRIGGTSDARLFSLGFRLALVHADESSQQQDKRARASRE